MRLQYVNRPGNRNINNRTIKRISEWVLEFSYQGYYILSISCNVALGSTQDLVPSGNQSSKQIWPSSLTAYGVTGSELIYSRYCIESYVTQILSLTYWRRDQMAAIFRTQLWNAIPSMKMYEYYFEVSNWQYPSIAMAGRRPDHKPLSEPMVVSLPTHICITRPQWVKNVLFGARLIIKFMGSDPARQESKH